MKQTTSTFTSAASSTDRQLSAKMALFRNPLFTQLRFGVLVIGVQIAIIILFVIFVQYGDQANKDPASFANKSYAAYDDVPNYYASARAFICPNYKK